MGRLFTGAANEVIRVDWSGGSSGFTLACWFYATNITAGQLLMATGVQGTSTTHRNVLIAAGNVGGDPVQAQVIASSARTASTTTGYAANQWQHAAAVFTSLSERHVYLNGGSKGSDGNNAGSQVTQNRLTIGNRFSGNALGNSATCIVAFSTAWSAALTEEEVLALSKNFGPPRVKPYDILHYIPMIREAIDLRGSAVTVAGSPTVAENPRMFL